MESILFIDRLPMHAYLGDDGEVVVEPTLPLVLAHHADLAPPRISSKHDNKWVYDTCYGGDALTSPELLEGKYNLNGFNIGMRVDPKSTSKKLHLNGYSRLRTAGVGESDVECPRFNANLWLVSNIPKLKKQPYLIHLSHGVTAEPGRSRHLIGRKLFISSGIKILLDYDERNPTLSLWVPSLPTDR